MEYRPPPGAATIVELAFADLCVDTRRQRVVELPHMTSEMLLLVGTAATLGVTHTAVGVDHTLPFVMLSRARNWSMYKTLGVTALCGTGHVLSSVVIGALGYFGLGLTLTKLELIEQTRGHWAAWALIVFGFGYALAGAWRLHSGDGHRHFHVHSDGTVHTHPHDHGGADSNVVHHHGHGARASLSKGRWGVALFLIFVLGPCEALLPLMAAPALGGSVWTSVAVAAVFGVATLSTMLLLVAVGRLGLKAARFGRLEPHMQWLSGIAIASSGLCVQFLGI